MTAAHTEHTQANAAPWYAAVFLAIGGWIAGILAAAAIFAFVAAIVSAGSDDADVIGAFLSLAIGAGSAFMGAQTSRNRRNDFARHFSIAAIAAGMTAATGGLWYLAFKAVDASLNFSDERFSLGAAGLITAAAFAVAGLYIIKAAKDGIVSFLITLAAYSLFSGSVIFLESPAENGLSASMLLSALSVLAGSVLFISPGARNLRSEAAALMIGPLIFYGFTEDFSRLIGVGAAGYVVFIAIKAVFALAALNALRRLRARYAAAPLIGAGVLALAGIWFLPPAGAVSIVILAAGFAANHRGLAAVGVLATTGFIGWYYYDLSTTLLEKSAIMAAMGAATLAGALLARRIGGNDREARETPSTLEAPVRRSILTAAAFGVLLALALANVNVSVWRLEADFKQARTIYLPLGPRDPRSIIQGDYMVLNFRQAIYPPAEEIEALPNTGQVFLRLDEEGVAAFSRIASPDDAPSQNEIRINYAKSSTRRMRYCPESFFFQEGEAPVYDDARFAVVLVAASGRARLTALADDTRTIIEPSADPHEDESAAAR